jgi:hypothetical protein
MCSFNSFTASARLRTATHYRGGTHACAAAERCEHAQDEFNSAAQARAWADGDFDADHDLGLCSLDGVGRSAHCLEPGARSRQRRGGSGCPRALAAVYELAHPPQQGRCEAAGLRPVRGTRTRI